MQQTKAPRPAWRRRPGLIAAAAVVVAGLVGVPTLIANAASTPAGQPPNAVTSASPSAPPAGGSATGSGPSTPIASPSGAQSNPAAAIASPSGAQSSPAAAIASPSAAGGGSGPLPTTSVSVQQTAVPASPSPTFELPSPVPGRG